MKTLAIEKVQSCRHYGTMDFVISGRSLLKEIERREYDYIPRLGSDFSPTDIGLREELLLEKTGYLSSGRVALYICKCGDYECGVISTKIFREGNHIIWSDFGYENECDKEFLLFDRIGPFRFEEKKYRQIVLDINKSD